jgi:hypothetical protein
MVFILLPSNLSAANHIYRHHGKQAEIRAGLLSGFDVFFRHSVVKSICPLGPIHPANTICCGGYFLTTNRTFAISWLPESKSLSLNPPVGRGPCTTNESGMQFRGVIGNGLRAIAAMA